MNLSSSSLVSVIVAKADSSRVPKKNFRSFYNHRCFVDLAVSLHFDSNTDIPLVLSTDNSSYVPNEGTILHRRSSNLAQVETPVLDVLLDIVRTYSLSLNSKIILLQPTSPFRTIRNYLDFISLSHELDAYTSAFSVYRVEDSHPARMYSMNTKYLESFLPNQSSLQSQELSPCYHRNGCFYAFNVSDILNGSLYSESLIPFVMPFESSVNVDTILDFKIAQYLYPHFVDGTLLDI